jgi:CDP-glucose 4,6-dehydratase
VFGGFYEGKRAFVTGHTGFKGSWLCLWLRTIGAEVTGYSLAPPTNPNLFEIVGDYACAKSMERDVRDGTSLERALAEAEPDVVFHLAAQPLVRRSYAEPIETLETNVTGTAHLLQALRRATKRTSVVVVTSDKCYDNREWEFAYRENDPLGGRDVYSMSKAAAELVAHAWNHSFFLTEPWLVRVGSGRAGNVIGGGDYAEDRLIPDAVRSLSSGKPVIVRNPSSTRPWQHVLESVSGYLWLAVCLHRAKVPRPALESINFGPGPSSSRPVREVVEAALRLWPGKMELAPDLRSPAEAKSLNVAIDRAVTELGWSPVWNFETAVRETIAWYKARHSGGSTDMLAFSVSQVDKYCSDAQGLGLEWAR